MENRKEMLLSYVKANVAPLLIDFMSFNEMDIAVVLPATIDVKDLMMEKILCHQNGLMRYLAQMIVEY